MMAKWQYIDYRVNMLTTARAQHKKLTRKEMEKYQDVARATKISVEQVQAILKDKNYQLENE
jgi:uncharacterized protein YdbL (DUF1318 family)